MIGPCCMDVHEVGANCLNIGYALTTLDQKYLKGISSSLQSDTNPFQPVTLIIHFKNRLIRMWQIFGKSLKLNGTSDVSVLE